jgi:hypothetical protein
MLLLLASFMVVVPSTDLSAAAGNPFLGRYRLGRDDDSRYRDKEKYEHSKRHVPKCQVLHFFRRFLQMLEGERILREPATANGPTVPPRQYFRHCS